MNCFILCFGDTFTLRNIFYKMTQATVLIISLLCYVVYAEERFHQIVKESQPVQWISCPDETPVVKIHKASWTVDEEANVAVGRDATCSELNDPNFDITTLYETACNGKKVCPVSAEKSDLFASSDVCSGVNILVDVAYSCRSFRGELEMPLIVSELSIGTSKRLICPEFSQIQILAAGYFNESTIPAGSDGLCPEMRTTDQLAKICDGEDGCEVSFTSEDYCANASSRLVIVHSCGQKSVVDVNSLRFLELDYSVTNQTISCTTIVDETSVSSSNTSLFLLSAHYKQAFEGANSTSSPCQLDITNALHSLSDQSPACPPDSLSCDLEFPATLNASAQVLCGPKELKLLITYFCPDFDSVQ